MKAEISTAWIEVADGAPATLLRSAVIEIKIESCTMEQVNDILCAVNDALFPA